MELNDLLRIAGIGLVIGILHVFFEQTGKKDFSFFYLSLRIFILQQSSYAF